MTSRAAAARDVPAGVGDPVEYRLVQAAVAGDADAFAGLYDRHVDRVYRHCYYWTANRADAEDLTQQTFLLAWQAIGRYRQTGAPLVTWLLTISDRLAISLHRRQREFVAEMAEPRADWGDPEAAVVAGLALDDVRRAILRLKPVRQQVIILRYIEGFSAAEIAAALGKTENNIYVIQHRALTDLRCLLREPTAAEPSHGVSMFRRLRGIIASRAGEDGSRPADE